MDGSTADTEASSRPGTFDDIGEHASSGTWPRLPKRSSRTRMTDPIDVWGLTHALAREKSELADQLSRLTAVELAAAEATDGGTPSATTYEDHPMDHGGGGGSGEDAIAAAARMAKLDELVAREHQQAGMGDATVDDRTLNSILGALQDQFKPDVADNGAPTAGGVRRDDAERSAPPTGAAAHATAEHVPHASPGFSHPLHHPGHFSYQQPSPPGQPQHVSLSQLRNGRPPPPHGYHHHPGHPPGYPPAEYHHLPPHQQPHPHHHPQHHPQHHGPPPQRHGPLPAGHQPAHVPHASGFSYPPPAAPRSSGKAPSSRPLPSSRGAPSHASAPARHHGGPAFPPLPPPLPKETLQAHSGGGSSLSASATEAVAMTFGEDDSPILLSADQLFMYEGLFDDADFLSHVVSAADLTPNPHPNHS